MSNWTSAAIVAAMAAALGAAQFAAADEIIETFEDGTNPAGWTWGPPWEVITQSGGNPGRYLRVGDIDTFAPMARSGWEVASAWTGDYRERGVTKVGIDLILHHVDFSAEGRPLSVLLISDNGTPNNFDDDWAAYFIGAHNVPLVGEGWKSYSFDIPSQETSTPPGWDYLQFGPDSPPNPDWNDVITKVDQLLFFFGDPTMFFIFQMWEVGIDNPRIEFVSDGATLTDVSAALGAIVSGDVPELLASDDVYLVADSQFGFTAQEANVLDLIVGAQSDVAGAQTMDLLIEMRLNNPGGLGRARLKNWSNSAFQQVGQFQTQMTDTVHQIDGIAAENRVRASDGRVELSIRASVLATFSVTGFTARFDHVRIVVN